MKTSSRITLLVAFAAVGTGLAIFLAGDRPPDVPRPPATTQSQRNSTTPAPRLPAPSPPPLLTRLDAAAEAGLQPIPANDRASTQALLPPPSLLSPQRAAEHPSQVIHDPALRPVAFQQPPADTAQVAPLSPASPPTVGSSVVNTQLPLPQQEVPSVVPPAPAPTEQIAPGRAIAQVQKGEKEDELIIDAQNADVQKVLSHISANSRLNILASKNVTGTISVSLSNVNAISAVEAILKATGFVARREGDFVYIGTPADLEDMDRKQDEVNTRIYRPNYVRAAELQALITPLLTPAIGKVAVSSASEVDLPADTVKTGGNSFAGSDYVMVRDYEMVLRQVDQLVAEVDLQPKQVSLEAMILSVKLDDQYQFGVDWQLFRDSSNARLISGSPLANIAQLNLTGDGLRFGFLDASTAVFMNALETIGETNVVAAPRVLCLNKQRAEILIGSQLGYVSTTVTENASTQSIEFLEVGTQLRIRPYIYTDGSMRLEVHPELSTGQVKVESGFTLPNKEVTQVTTNIMCRDGSTVIIGGLIREDLTNDVRQIPFLGSLPYVGPVFRDKTEKISRHEIIVLITPRLVYEPGLSGEGKQVKEEFAIRQANYADKMSPIARRHYGRRQLRLAYAAYNAGDTRSALRYANMSVHFDPMNLEAHNLRTQVAALHPELDNNLHYYLKDGLRPWEHPHRNYTKSGYPWSPGNPPAPEELLVEPIDVGTPGSHITLQPSPPPQRKLAP